MARWVAFVLGVVGLVACGCGGRATQGSSSTAPDANAAASDVWVDSTYAPKPNVLAALAIAPVPEAGEKAQQLDEALERVFLDTPGSQVRGQPGDIRRRMNGNREFVLLIDRIRSLQYSPAALAGANLNVLMSTRELADLRTSLNSATLLVLPIEFVVEPQARGTNGRAVYRVYSLETGKLVMQNKLHRHVAMAGEAGARETTIQLILGMQADFAARLLP